MKRAKMIKHLAHIATHFEKQVEAHKHAGRSKQMHENQGLLEALRMSIAEHARMEIAAQECLAAAVVEAKRLDAEDQAKAEDAEMVQRGADSALVAAARAWVNEFRPEKA